jgi:hypothetical protein
LQFAIAGGEDLAGDFVFRVEAMAFLAARRERFKMRSKQKR